MLRQAILARILFPYICSQTISGIVKHHVAFGTVKNSQRLVGGIPPTHSVPNPVVRTPKREDVSVLVEMIIPLAKTVNGFIRIEMIPEIESHDIAIRVEPECEASGVDSRHLLAIGILE